jgi:endonuclease/exonuclease/phosphatase (EEP) superfamily protein YafD
VSETHFTEHSYVNVPNYITYATNHPDGRAHAGSAIIVRKGIKHHELPKHETDHIQATNISIEDWDVNLTISVIYCPPRHKIKTEQYNAFINALEHTFLVGGDFNAKHQYWGSRLVNPKGCVLYQTIQEKQLQILSTGEPTYWPTDINKTPYLLDVFIFKGLSHNSLDIRPNLEIASDHTPIIATISKHIITHQNYTTAKQTGKHSEMKSKKINDSTQSKVRSL